MSPTIYDQLLADPEFPLPPVGQEPYSLPDFELPEAP